MQRQPRLFECIYEERSPQSFLTLKMKGGGRASQSFGYLNHQCRMGIPSRGYRMGIPDRGYRMGIPGSVRMGIPGRECPYSKLYQVKLCRTVAARTSVKSTIPFN